MSHRTKPWLCHACGHLLNAVSEVGGEDIAPVEGDLTMCIGCGAFYTLQGDAWARLTLAQYAALTPDERDLLIRMRVALERMPREGGR
jgi:hypothetical protein